MAKIHKWAKQYGQWRTLTAPKDVTVEIQEEVEWAPIPVLHIYDQHWCQPEWKKHCYVNIKFTRGKLNTPQTSWRRLEMKPPPKRKTTYIKYRNALIIVILI